MICINKNTGRKISAIIPVHIFGHPCKIEAIIEVAKKYRIEMVEDAAESLGSFTKGNIQEHLVSLVQLVLMGIRLLRRAVVA